MCIRSWNLYAIEVPDPGHDNPLFVRPIIAPKEASVGEDMSEGALPV